MHRSRGWAPRGSQAITTTSSTKATSHSILGAISAASIVNMKLRESGNIKRRKVVGATKKKAPEDQLSVQFINDTMDIMNEFQEMKECFIIMDNAPIHIPEMIDPITMKRGYTPVYLPPYSPELNSIEQFWAIIKRGKLSDVETLTTRIIEASEAVPIVHLQHPVDQFEKCRNKIPI